VYPEDLTMRDIRNILSEWKKFSIRKCIKYASDI